MTETIHIDREGELYRILIEAHLEPDKVSRIHRLVEDDAGDARITLGERRRLRRLTARGLVTPATMRLIITVLAA